MIWNMVVAVYLVVLNLIGFIMMGADKKKAIRHKWRIPEKTLFLIAILGGSLGGIIGMRTYRHKTKHMYFVVGFPFIFIVQVGVIMYILA